MRASGAMFLPRFFVTSPSMAPSLAAVGAFNAITVRPPDRQPDWKGSRRMKQVERQISGGPDRAIATRVWREIGQLALEGVAIGLAFSILLAAAVYMVARNAHDDRYSTAQESPTVQAAAAVSA